MSNTELGELYLLPVSPWSRRVLLVLRHSRASVNVQEYRPFVTPQVWRLTGRLQFGAKSTAPTLLQPNGDVLMDSYTIARLIDAARAPNVPTVFPDEHCSEIRALTDAAETLMCFSRTHLFTTLGKNPALTARLYLPRWTHGLPLTETIASSLNDALIRKYKDESSKSDEAAARDAFHIVNEAIRKSKSLFLLNDSLTYADFAVALSVSFNDNRSSHFRDVPSHPIGDEFPEVRQWAQRFTAKYVTKAAVSFPSPSHDADSRTMSWACSWIIYFALLLLNI